MEKIFPYIQVEFANSIKIIIGFLYRIIRRGNIFEYISTTQLYHFESDYIITNFLIHYHIHTYLILLKKIFKRILEKFFQKYKSKVNGRRVFSLLLLFSLEF